MTTFPIFTRVTQRWDQPRIPDVEAAVAAALEAGGLRGRLRPGMVVAITAGSRGVARLPEILRAAVAFCRTAECKPFLFPAMGSHGGGTAEGQRALLADLGITEASMGAEIRATMEVVQVAETREGLPVYLDRHAAAADGILVINRVKAHTDFEGRFESGLAKMMTIGMGKHAQALAVHQHGAAGLREHTPRIAAAMLATGRVLGALAIVENAEEAPALLEALLPGRILEREPALLETAKAWAARLPADTLDILLVEELGKEISGTGMDTNVIGRRGIPGEPDPPRPRVTTLVVLDVTAASHGNALGVGLADITTDRIVRQIDRASYYANVLTSGFLERGKVPLHFPTDREAIAAALHLNRRRPLEAIRFAWIKNTLHLKDLLVSEALLSELRGRSDLVLDPRPVPMTFTPHGTLVSPLRPGPARPAPASAWLDVG
ncbi:MAG: DUF2088 domain-containing protein [Candidatus Methylomirabilales bacterium]